MPRHRECSVAKSDTAHLEFAAAGDIIRRSGTVLNEVTVPRARSLAGFKSGTWLRALQGDRGMSVLLFDSEDAARAAADQIRSQGPPEGSPVTMESVDA